jgi:spermidine/putrescine-binding protein
VKIFSGTASQVGKEISIGEITYGLSIDTYAGEIIRRFGEERLGYVIPTDYPAVNGDGIAVIKGAPHKEVADAFISFVLSEEGQRVWFSKRGSPGGPVDFDIGKLSILPAMYKSTETSSVVKGSPFEWTGALRYDAVLGARRWNIVNDLFGAFVIDVHDRLKHLVRGTPTAEARIARFPVEERVISTLLADPAWLKTPELRSATLRDWGAVARTSLPAKGSLWQSLQWLPSSLFGVFLVVSLLRRRKKR